MPDSPSPTQCIGFRGYQSLDHSEPDASLIYRADGQPFEAVGKLGERKTHLIRGSANSWIYFDRAAAKAAHTIWKVEGIPDAMAIFPHLPQGHAVVTNTHGASSVAGPDMEVFAGKTANIAGDADEAGESGARKYAASISKHADVTKVVKLPYPIEEKHGKDLRDYFAEGGAVEALLESAETWEPKQFPATGSRPSSQPRRFMLTDVGNSERLIYRYGDQIRYCHPWQKWLVWDGMRWKIDNEGMITALAKDVAREMWDQVPDILDDNERAAFAKHATSTQQSPRIKSMIYLSRSAVPILPEALDKHLWLLNCTNGTLELKTGNLRGHRQDDYITKLCPTAFHPNAKAPVFEKFINQVLDHNSELIGFVQRLLGYCLTGDVSQQCLPIFWGQGSNGKSTLMDVVRELLGPDYSMKSAKDFLISKRLEGHATERMDLFGKRFVVTSETEDGHRLAESFIKDPHRRGNNPRPPDARG